MIATGEYLAYFLLLVDSFTFDITFEAGDVSSISRSFHGQTRESLRFHRCANVRRGRKLDRLDDLHFSARSVTVSSKAKVNPPFFFSIQFENLLLVYLIIIIFYYFRSTLFWHLTNDITLLERETYISSYYTIVTLIFKYN